MRWFKKLGIRANHDDRKSKSLFGCFCANTVCLMLVSSPALATSLDPAAGIYSTLKANEAQSKRKVSNVFDIGREVVVVPEEVQAETNFGSPERVQIVSKIATGAIEREIFGIALEYADHPGRDAANLSLMEWVTLFRANIEIESGFNASAISPKGAIGLGQLMPGTADALGVNPYDISENLSGSARYLLMLLETFGSKELALAGYNAGPDAVRRFEGIPPYKETINHVKRVMEVYETNLTGGAS